MSWLRRLLQPPIKPTELERHSPSGARWQAMPTVKFDPSAMSKSVKVDLRRNIDLLPDLESSQTKHIYELALRFISAGGDLHLFCTELMKMNIKGMTTERAAEIGRSLSNKTKAVNDRERQTSLGITHAIWMYPNAPCMKDAFRSRPTAADVQQDSAHRLANGKQYEISKGLLVDGKWTWPGIEDGCKCVSRPVLPGLEA
jgi:hypothetical protein